MDHSERPRATCAAQTTLVVAGAAAAVLVAVAAMLSVFFAQPFYSDFQIVLEGGYRISLGQVPYRDFYMPVGPVTFYMQALAIWLLGPGAWSMAAHSATLAGLLALGAYVLARHRHGVLLSAVVAVFMAISHNVVWAHPWYNQTAYFFFLLGAMLLIRGVEAPRHGKAMLAALALLSALAVLSKQDLAVAVPLLALYLWLAGKARLGAILGAYLAPFLLVLALVALAYEAVGDFFAWFNYGQIPGNRAWLLKSSYLETLVWNWRLWALGLLGIYTVAKRLRGGEAPPRTLLAMVLVLVPFVTMHTSGLGVQAKMQAVPLIALLLLWEMEEVTRGRLPGAALRVVMVLGLLFGAPIASVVKSVRVNLALAQGAEPATLARLGIGDAVRLGVGNEKGVLMHRQARDDLARIRETIAAGDRNFVNLSELSFLYQDFDQPPPEGLPLWFDHGISFQDAHIGLLTDGVVARGPEVILLQDAHDHGDRELHGKLSTYYREHGYRIAFEVRAPRRAERPITVFVRR